MKLIVLLRNPIDRAYSHWNMARSRNWENLSFWDATHYEQERLRKALPFQHRKYSYVDRGFYLTQLRRLWLFFPKDQILILKHEDLRDQPQETLENIYEFLGVEKLKNIKAKNVHSRSYPSKMSDKERDYLRFIFEHEIRGIERALDWDCSQWLA